MSDERAEDALFVYDSFAPGEEGLREALTSTGNGYFCTRGAAEWQDARSDPARIPRQRHP